MMKKATVKKSMMYTVDLTKIDGDGAFPCPKCGSIISPDDESEEVYQIVETKVKNDELAELMLTCNKCGITIKLVGFLSQPEDKPKSSKNRLELLFHFKSPTYNSKNYPQDDAIKKTIKNRTQIFRIFTY